METAFAGRMLDADGHQKPCQAAQIKRGQHGAGHVHDRIVALHHRCAAKSRKQHDEHDDKRQ
jgi:hypothetical protein